MLAKITSITLIQLAYFLWAIPAVLFATATKKKSPGALAKNLGAASVVTPGAPMSLAASKNRHDILIRQAVRRASHWLPGAHHCLPQAIASAHMLRVLKRSSRVFIGLRANPEGGEWDSHAWVTTEDGTVVGGEVAREFTPVTMYLRGNNHSPPSGSRLKSD